MGKWIQHHGWAVDANMSNLFFEQKFVCHKFYYLPTNGYDKQKLYKNSFKGNIFPHALDQSIGKFVKDLPQRNTDNSNLRTW